MFHIGERVLHYERTLRIQGTMVKHKFIGIEKASHQYATWLEDAVTLTPDRRNVRNEQSGGWAVVGKGRQIGHVAFNEPDDQVVALRDKAILRKLSRRGIEERDLGAQRREDGGLLPAPGRQT